MKRKVVYEQPLNDRMRHLLRLEHLFAGIKYHIKGPGEWDSRSALDNLVEVLDFISRMDFKVELIKDLEHHAQTLERWQNTPNINTERLSDLLKETKTFKQKLEGLEAQGEGPLLKNQLFNILKQRINILGGRCRSDLPNYHHWLQKNPKQRQNELSEWFFVLEPLREALELDLYLIRNNAVVTQETAIMGLFQSKLDSNVTYQMIQVLMPLEHPCYPEINAGKQRFSVRFFEQPHIEERALQTEQDISFELCCCMI